MREDAASELTRLIKVKGLPAEPVVVEANEHERAALATRFGLSQIDYLRAVVELEQRPGAIRASGTMKASFLQPCAVSGEDFSVEVEEPLYLRFVEAEAGNRLTAEDTEIELTSEDCDEIDYSGDAFDLGEAVAQTLGLVIDPYAEGPNADEARAKAGIVKEGEQEGPLADMLRNLTKD
ncbi:DUF177 domain-containing protein [Erythrobacter sp. SCSIO 43205]|uniref:DUF177 domain-containing protein n=1 Tax=Erythrobacter sp. SCSIO 43205 TaxID=2779361 RepID=UPI001CA92691|nr:DUF177 domain-containing protein [Erythrobacter sp. SCSIO 43205]UAB78883.1 DUF177 domain-containing protein [Erythrobacter sp. SCSIO 43205]